MGYIDSTLQHQRLACFIASISASNTPTHARSRQVGGVSHAEAATRSGISWAGLVWPDCWAGPLGFRDTYRRTYVSQISRHILHVQVHARTLGYSVRCSSPAGSELRSRRIENISDNAGISDYAASLFKAFFLVESHEPALSPRFVASAGATQASGCATAVVAATAFFARCRMALAFKLSYQ